ncbi:oxidoreductase [Filobacillus milosensis]|uniref:Oxidoreductase n=1 Tax=Filobacillus milosensis TaxID=94137 RepID=A0A4Y8IBM8_9BACI|nr:NAD(P)/FAD-dependent oxidoreductase [Filobacillus milosensis]TFB13300.1 oxidoreductase [Filobacillus milosensis]
MYHTIVIGAGQAGLVMGYYLKQLNQSFIILDKNKEIGEVWKNRYDSLVLFTPRLYSSLPGLKLKGDPQGFPHKDEIAQYLTNYAVYFNLPISLNTEVINIRKQKGVFVISTSKGEYHSQNVIIATGPFQKPNIPTFSSNLSKDIIQLHSSEYRNPSQLKSGSVLVVGSGNSGAQIAVEVSKYRETYLSSGHKLKFFPLNIGSKSIFWYLDKLGLYKANVNSKIGQFLRKQHDPIFGFELENLIKKRKIILKPRTKILKNDSFVFEDESQLKVNNVIWATGFKSNYSWIDLPGLFDEKGMPIHQRGVTSIDGLYFLGLAWQSSRGSALLQGVGADAKYLYKYIVNKNI